MKLDQPAMPGNWIDVDSMGDRVVRESHPGFTKREYAAIHLCVPDSGNDELDAMIRRAQRERLAGQAPIDELSVGRGAKEPNSFEARYLWADAVIAAGEVGK